MLIAFAFLKTALEQFQQKRGECNRTHTQTTEIGTTISQELADKRTGNSKMMMFPLDMSLSSIETADAVETVDDTMGTTGIITLQPGARQCCHEILEKHVTVIGNSGTHDHGSSKVKLKNIVDYKWELKNYPGHLIAVHIDGQHIAYVINVNNKASRVEGMVRVVNALSGLRALIKGMGGEVLDLQFAQIEKERILASIDLNSLFVHKIDLLKGTLLCNLMIKIEDPLANYTPKFDKISWCPFIDTPVDDDDDDSQLIVWARGSLFQCFNVKVIVEEHGIGQISPKDIATGYVKCIDEALTITCVAFSPDGSTIGVGSTDGVIRFYLVYMHDKEPRCLHQWKPHNGKPMSSFFFLDDLTHKTADTYWKFAITGANNNTEFKVWNCANWECLQSLKLTTSDETKSSHFIAEIDRTASYLVLTNMDTRTCYVLQIVNNSNNSLKFNNSKDSDCDLSALSDTSKNIACTSLNVSLANRPSSTVEFTKLVYIKSIAEFPLSSGILSFSIVDAAVRRLKCANDNYLCDELDDYDEETNSIYCVVVRMFIVQSKSMQECHILYQPTLPENSNILSSLSSSSSTNLQTSDSFKTAEILSVEKNISTNGNATSENEKVEPLRLNKVKQEQTVVTEQTALEALLGINSSSQHAPITKPTTLSIAAPTATVLDKIEKKVSVSPQITGFPQLNLMTPDSFGASSSSKIEKTPDCVSSEVLNTILMLANSVAGQTAASAATTPMADIKIFNNKIIESTDQQKMQLNQSLEAQKKFVAIDNHRGRNVQENLTSGGSSPSREVQEIMSYQDFEKNSFSGDELLDDDDEDTAKVLSDTVDDGTDTSVSKLKKNGSKKKWPKAPDMHKVSTTKRSAELQNAANLISQAVHASSACSLTNSHVAPTLLSGHNNNSNINNNNLAAGNDLTEMNIKIDKLLDLVQMQSKKINSLQTDINDLKKSNPATNSKNMAELSFKLEMQLSKLMEQYLKRYENEHNKKLSVFMTGRDVQNRELRDSFMQIINQFMVSQLSEVVSKVVTIEIQRQIAPLIGAKIDHLQKQLQLDVSQKLTAFDLMLKDNVAQVCKSKSIIDTFGKSVLVGVQGAFIESMSSTLIPAYEKSSQNMFKQLHEAFSIGIKEFMEQFDNYLQHMQPSLDSSGEIVTSFSDFRQHVDTILIKHIKAVTELVTELVLDKRKDAKSLEILLVRSIQETVRVEVRKNFETQAMTLRSKTNTPAPMYDIKDSIKMLLQSGQINKAFHQALLANDLNLVEFTLNSIDHNVVFSPNCCLEQKVLLSLIQQISADMSSHNEVKQNYLSDALLAINANDSITQEHAPKVVQDLLHNCQLFLMHYPKSAQCSNVRMMLRSVEAFRSQF